MGSDSFFGIQVKNFVSIGTIALFLLLTSCNPIPVEEARTIDIDALSVTEASVEGGSTIVITGADFIGIESVTFGSKPCTDLVIIDETTLRCVIPANAPGEVVVTITGKGNRVARASFTYVYDELTISSVYPTGGNTDGGSLITLQGTGFTADSEISLGGTACTPVVFVDSTLIKCTSPQKTAGEYTFTIVNSNGQTYTGRTFTYREGPTVSSISPSVGSNLGGTVITISGSNFLDGATVKIGTRSCYDLEVDEDDDTITCTAPLMSASATPYDVIVTNPDLQSDTLDGAYTAVQIPSITSISAASGSTLGGTTITILGKNFFNTSTVTLGGAACGTLTYFSSTRLICVTAATAGGTYDLVVTNTNTYSATLEDAFTFVPPPEIDSISPTFGRLTAGTEITISGSGFQSGATVSFGTDPIADATACTDVQVTSTEITCTAPARAAGLVNVYVTNPDTQSDSLTNGYRFQGPPTITSMTPRVGDPDGGTTVTITGTNFSDGATVLFGGDACTVTDVDEDADEITCTTPAGTDGSTVSVTVTNTDSQYVTASSYYTFRDAATVDTISSDKGPAGRTLTITGTNFATGIVVTLGGTECSGGATVVSATSLTCVTPVSVVLGAVDLVVYNLNDQPRAVTVEDAYTYQLAPVVTSITPSQGPSAGGTPVTIAGENFLSGAEVSLGGALCDDVVVVDSETITCTTIAAVVTGDVSVTVTNTDDQEDVKTSPGFNYILPPTISSISPTYSLLNSVTRVTITGTDFLSPSVTIDGNTCTIVSSSATSIVCDAPSSAVAGDEDVVVENSDGQDDDLAGGFTYVGAPVISSITPNGAAPNTPTVITITGEYLIGAEVDFGNDDLCTSVQINDDWTELTCTTPSLPAGDVTVTLTNSNNLSDTETFTFRNPPAVTSVSPTWGSLNLDTDITLTGTGFLEDATVTVGGISCTDYDYSNVPTTIVCTVPASLVAGAKTIVVTNPDQQDGDLSPGLTILDQPTISGIGPDTVDLDNQEEITITGTNFFTGASVTVGGTPCANIVVVSTTSITCDVPVKVAGDYDVVVTNVDNLATDPFTLTYEDNTSVPTFDVSTPVSPTSGIEGDLVTINGTDFFEGIEVSFDGAICTNVQVLSSTQLTCELAAHTPGLIAITLTNDDGGTVTSSPIFTYDYGEPTISGASPSNVAAGDAISISGTNLYGATVVINGSVPCTIIGSVNTDGTSLSCYPSVDVTVDGDPEDISVTNIAGSASLSGAFTFVDLAAPTIDVMSPPSPSSGFQGDTLTINGTNFNYGTSVVVGAGALCAVQTVTSTQITCTLGNPDSIGVKDVTVTNLDGDSGFIDDAFVYLSSPVISSFSHSTVLENDLISIYGSDFVSGATVDLSGSSCLNISVSSNEITCNIPGGLPTQFIDVTVTNPDGEDAYYEDAFNFNTN